MPRLTASFDAETGTVILDIDSGDGLEIIRRLELRSDGHPLMHTSFSLHDDSKRLHTICRRDSPEIDEVDW